MTLRSDPDGDGTYDVVELHESFDNDGDNFRDMAPEHDAAGNLTFDGLKQYTYDAFNRLVKVENAFKDPDYNSGALAVGSTIAEYAYDGSASGGRRVRKDTYIGGGLDSVEHFYCIGDTLVETRNGSSQVIQQHVWHSLSRDYIDSLAEVSNNTNPGVDDTCDQRLFTLQDQQFNILALVDTSGGIVERYEYSLYGERTILNATFVVLHESAYGLHNGFQGLYHDVETGLIYNRARMLNVRLKRFNQRDPLGYPDGMNSYAAYHVLWGTVDPFGLEGSWVDTVLGGNMGAVGMAYNAGKAYHNTRKSGGSFTAAVGNAARSSLGETTGFNAFERAAEDYQATRDLGQSHSDAAAIAAAKNAPVAGTIWEAGEAVGGERCGGANHGEQMSPQERAQAGVNAFVEAVGAVFGIRARWGKPTTGPPSPAHSTPSPAKPTATQSADICPKTKKEHGSYTNTHESGKEYHGQGDRKRSQVSGKEKADAYEDPHIATDWTSAPSRRQAMKDEAERIKKGGGKQNPDNYNKIDSPGKKYSQEDGDS